MQHARQTVNNQGSWVAHQTMLIDTWLMYPTYTHKKLELADCIKIVNRAELSCPVSSHLATPEVVLHSLSFRCLGHNVIIKLVPLEDWGVMEQECIKTNSKVPEVKVSNTFWSKIVMRTLIWTVNLRYIIYTASQKIIIFSLPFNLGLM